MLMYTSYLIGTTTTVSKESLAPHSGRKQALTRHTQLSQSMHIPPQKVVLAAVTYNKTQLVDDIVETLLAQKQQLSSTNHKRMVTGRDPVPVEISHGMTIRREDLRNAHEEVDVIIIH